jgi:hypothetical protein
MLSELEREDTRISSGVVCTRRYKISSRSVAQAPRRDMLAPLAWTCHALTISDCAGRFACSIAGGRHRGHCSRNYSAPGSDAQFCTQISTRRFFCQPIVVSLQVTGNASQYSLMTSFRASIDAPVLISASLTAFARFLARSQLDAWSPLESANPAISMLLVGAYSWI